jgi:hypothetical protein
MAFPYSGAAREVIMNTANLQLEGLLIAVAALNRMLVDKGLANSDEIDQALAQADSTARNGERMGDGISPANREAVLFPIKLLRAANRAGGNAAAISFAALAGQVGRSKDTGNA